jgi:hypothetical protein
MYMGVKAESGGKTQCHAQLLSPRDYMITSRTVPVSFVDTLLRALPRSKIIFHL